MTTTFKTEIRNVQNCPCGENVKTLGDSSPYNYAFRPNVAVDKYIAGVTIPANASSLWERTAMGKHPLCPPIRATPQRAFHSKYDMAEWQEGTLGNLKDSEGERNIGEQIRCDSLRTMRNTDCLTTFGQRDSTQRLGERIGDVNYWRSEVLHELEMNVMETKNMEEIKRQAECLLRELEGPLKIDQESLYAREQRMGIDQVHDCVEVALNREVEVIKEMQSRMCRLLERIAQTLQELQDSRNCLERDALDKFSTLNIDKYSHGLMNDSPNIALYPGIEQWDRTMSTVESWLDYTIRLIQRSQNARAESTRLRNEAESTFARSVNELWLNWNNTNEALATRVQQTTDIKNRVQAELSRLVKELADQQRYRQALQRALEDKCGPLKVAHTRLERRTHRPCMELCRDNAMIRLQGEVFDLYGSIDQLKQRLAAVEASIATLLMRKNKMEEEHQIKTNSLLIDRERVLGARRAFPITCVVTKCQ